MKIYSSTDSIDEITSTIIAKGFAVLSGTITPVRNLSERVIVNLHSHDAIEPVLSYLNALDHGYYYYIRDLKMHPDKIMIDQFILKNLPDAESFFS